MPTVIMVDILWLMVFDIDLLIVIHCLDLSKAGCFVCEKGFVILHCGVNVVVRC